MKPEFQFIVVLSDDSVEYVKNETELKQLLAGHEQIDIYAIHEIKRDIKYKRTPQPDKIQILK